MKFSTFCRKVHFLVFLPPKTINIPCAMEGFSPSARVEVKNRKILKFLTFHLKFDFLRKITLFMKNALFGKKCAGRGNSSVAQRFLMVLGGKNAKSAFFHENHQKVRIFTLFTFSHPNVTAFRKKQKICTFPTFCASAGPAAERDRQRLDPAAAPPAHAGNSYPVGGLPRPPTPIEIYRFL